MASHKPFFALLFSLLLPFFLPISSFAADADLVADLTSLRSQSDGGVIRLNDNLLRRIVSHKRRSFSFLIFFDAAQLHSKSELQLPTLRSEYSIVSSSFIDNHKDHDDSSNNNNNNADLSKLFFFDIEFQESQNSFALFGVNALPHIRLVNPSVEVLKSSDHLDQGSFNSLAESLADFVESKTKVSIGPMHRPPLFSRKQLAFFAVVLLALTPFAFKKIVAGETLLHDYKLWLFGAIFVYFFSVSGTMHNIIRKMPMFIPDRNDPSKVVFFYQGSGMQLGAEGFTIGFLYTTVGLLLALMTHGLVKLRNSTVQRIAMVIALIVSFWAVQKVIFLDNWKTGYGVHGYWPSSW